jgi:hypothetical protein
LLSDTENGIKKGKSLLAGCSPYSGEKSISISDWEGDNYDAIMHSVGEGGLIDAQTSDKINKVVMAVMDGLPCIVVTSYAYGHLYSYWQDVRAFANIEEIYFKYADDYFDFPIGEYPNGRQIGELCGLKLTDGTLIQDGDWGRFNIILASEMRKDPATGVYGDIRNGSFSCSYNMFWTGDDYTGTPSAAMPDWLKQPGLRFIDGFDNYYLGLRAQSAVHFNNYYCTEIPQLAPVQINFQNSQAIVSAILDYIQTRNTGF